MRAREKGEVPPLTWRPVCKNTVCYDVSSVDYTL